MLITDVDSFIARVQSGAKFWHIAGASGVGPEKQYPLTLMNVISASLPECGPRAVVRRQDGTEETRSVYDLVHGYGVCLSEKEAVDELHLMARRYREDPLLQQELARERGEDAREYAWITRRRYFR